jgi:N-acetylmuramoyl-L-alanine amidase
VGIVCFPPEGEAMAIEAEIQSKIDAAVTDGDEEALRKLLSDLYEQAEHSEKPFDASIRLRPEVAAEIADLALESDAAMNWANRISRAARWLAYRRKTARGFDGLRIVEEGDSWFQYPLLLDDTIDQLSRDDDKAIFSLSGAGDLLGDMADRREYVDALQKTAAPVLLLSGGGNDLLGGGRFASVLLPYAKDRPPADLLNMPLLEVELRKVLQSYRRILIEVRQRFPKVRTFGHAYDLPYPQSDGRWIGKPLTERGIPHEIGRLIVELVMNRFSAELNDLQSEFSNFCFVDLRGKVDRGRQSWFDELHPKNPGFGRTAQVFREAIAEAVSKGIVESARAGTSIPVTRLAPGAAAPGLEAASSPTIVLDPGHGGAPPPTKVGGSSWNNAIGPEGSLEKTLTLDIAKRVKAQLEGRGHRVLLTRESDVNLSLASRASVAQQTDAAVFVSIHFNASTGHNAQGTETFVHPTHSDASRRLCLAVQRAVVAELGLRDRNKGHPGGIKKGSFGVINAAQHSAKTAVVLHEVSFLDRVDEEQKLKTTTYRDRIARALAGGIKAYLGVGVESFEVESDSAEIGDAIELGAFEAGQSVPVYLGLAEAALPSWQGGHALPFESDQYGSRDDHDIARQIAGILARDDVPEIGEAEDDRHEFANVDPGRGFNFSDLGRNLEADTSVLASVFSGLESAGFDMARYEAIIRGLRLRHFSPAEFLFPGTSNAPGGSCAGKNALPPEALWDNIGKTARMLEEIRERLGAPVRILSCYRSPAYNACVGGATNSLHGRFNAIDWYCDAGTAADWHRVAQEVRRAHPEFAGGIGRYRGFCHVDTRGADSDWTG